MQADRYILWKICGEEAEDFHFKSDKIEYITYMYKNVQHQHTTRGILLFLNAS